jgi:Tol biopolymer transport system component/DNA-binding winged helix-turn-helix (wHTH) protein
MHPFRLGDWLVEPELNRITGWGTSHQVEPKIVELLACLASKPGGVLTRNELLDRVWQDVVVNEEVLTRAVSELRRILHDDPQNPRYIETIRKRGYRLVSEVAWVEAREAAGSEPGSDPQMPPIEHRPRSRRRRRQWALVGLLVVAAAVVIWQIAGHRAGWISRGDTEVEPYRTTPLTSYPGKEQTPAISPDGSMVAFAWNGPEGDNVDIYVKQVDAETPLRLTDDPAVDIYPIWSPDARELAFIHADESGSYIYTMPVVKGEPRRLIQARGQLGGMHWSPDGRHMVYAENASPDAQFRLYMHDLETGESQRLTAPDSLSRGDVGPVYSPDGETIAFIRLHASGEEDIFVVPAGGGDARRVTENRLQLRGLDWTQDGRSLVCSAASDGGYSLWRVDVRNGERRWIPVPGERIYTPSVARDASRMVYHSTWFNENIWCLRREKDTAFGYTAGALITSTRCDCEARFSPDGKRLAFVSTRSGSYQIWTCESDGARPLQLTAFEKCMVNRPRWSPDGRRIAFTAKPEGFSDLYVIGADGGRPRRATFGAFNSVLASWSRDGEWIYFASDRSGGWQLWKLRPDAPESTPPVQVTTDGAMTGYESIDGRYLYYTKPAEAGLWRLSLSEGDTAAPVRILSELPEKEKWDVWTLDRRGIILLDRRGEAGRSLVMYEFATGDITPLGRVADISSESLAISPDGERILYTRIDRDIADLMLVDGFR